MRDEVIIEIEKKLFAHFYQDKSLIPQFKEEDFVTDIARGIYPTLLQHKDDPEWSVTKLFYWISTDAQKEVNKDSLEIIFGDPPEESVDFLRDLLLKERVKRNLKTTILNDIGRVLDSRDEINPTLIENAIQKLSNGLQTIEYGGKHEILKGEEIVDRYAAVIQRRKEERGFWTTGCSHLDSMLTEGFAPGKITSIYAASGIGKSSYALYLVNRQINLKIPSIYITLEMDLASTMDRLVSMRSKIPLRYFYKKNAEEFMENIKLVEAAVEKESAAIKKNKSFRIVDNPSMSIADIEAIVERAKMEMNTDYLICTIDLLSMVREFNSGEGSTADRYEHAMNALFEVARRTKCHFVGVFQSKRNSVPVSKEEDIEKLRPKIENIKNSGAIEERSRIIISLFRKKFYLGRYFPTSPNLESMQDLMEVKIDKQNMGSLGVKQYYFDPESSYLCRWIEEPAIPPYTPEQKTDDSQENLVTN